MKWSFPWKRMITNLQLIQFVSGLGVLLPYMWVSGYWTSLPRRGGFVFNYAYVSMNLCMFINFYRKTYLQKKKAAVTKSAESTDLAKSSTTSEEGEKEADFECARYAEASFIGSTKILAKSAMLLLLGYLFTSRCCFPSYLVPLGVFLSGVALTGMDCAREDCRKGVFFPKSTPLLKVNLNKAFSAVFDILLNSWDTMIFGAMASAAVGVMYAESANPFEFLYRLNYFF